MNYYLQDVKAAFEKIKSGQEGLSSNEAMERLEKNGKNRLEEGKKTSLAMRFLKQLIDPMTLILIVAAAISGATSFFANEPFTDVFIIMAVVVINSVLGVYQESKAEKAIEALQEMTSATSKVIRDGKVVSVKSEDLVVGDVVVLEAGDLVPADGRIIECASMKVEEAALTGESVPVDKTSEVLELGNEKDVPLGDRKNMVYMGSVVVYGRGRAVITATGMDSEMGKIAGVLSQAVEGQTPLQIKLSQLSKILSYMVIGICAFIFAFSLVRSGDFSGEVMLDTFMVAVSLAVAAIPEGLATVVTIVLSIGVTNMSKNNAVIRKLTAVETLGCAQIICSDKTGTLTQNKMTVTKTYGDEKTLATAMALCNDAELGDKDGAVGEPTEAALVNFANKIGLSKNELKKQLPRVFEVPFESMRKMMSTIHQKADGTFVQFTKGAPDEVLKKCTKFLQNGEVKELTEDVKNTIMAENKNMADSALRVLCAAYKEYEAMPGELSAQVIEDDLIFIGLTGMIDPVRPEVLDAIEKCKMAGVRPIMITGDHIDTAIAIATELGIIKDKSEAITGSMLNEMSDEDLAKNIEAYGVYARVQPEHKVRIVNAWKSKNMVVAMTGDGVNDAPSIKSADIGVGMGITGTDVTKNVADMVLADDNFATIVYAVEEGRKIYDNIRKAIQFLLGSNLSEVLSIFFATLMGFVILKPVHLLWINLVTDSIPALALGMEEAEKDIMERKPRDKKEGIFAGGLGFDIIYQGIMVTIITLAAYFIGGYIQTGAWEISQSTHGITMAFLTMSMAEIFHSFNMRSQRNSIFKITRQNVYLILGMVLAFSLTTLVLYVPSLADAFGFEPVSLVEYAIAIALALSVIPTVEIVKFIQRRLKK
ncbi:MAG: cation-translocating P-type ATPase [Eubacteriales bacterium]|jgi:Ca2+-transporting ATPase|nr:cation-translocating P-type ATPase [Eubacteriales bacterium]